MKKFTVLFTLFILFQTGFGQIPSNGLIGYWPFKGNANDKSGKSNNGDVIGAKPTFNRLGIDQNAYYFNGISNYIGIKSNKSLQFDKTNQTISFWMKISDIQKENEPVGIIVKTDQHLSTDSTEKSSQGFRIYFDQSGNMCYDIKNGIQHDWTKCFIPADKIILNQYANYVFKKDKDSLYAFLNGNKINSTVIPNGINIGNNSAILLIGKMKAKIDGNSMGFFKGELDDIRIYNRALNKKEITILYNDCSGVSLPVASNTSHCGKGKITLRASKGDSYRWYDVSSGGSVIGTDSIFTTQILSKSKTYYVSNYKNGCESKRIAVQAIIDILPTVVFNGLNDSYCKNASEIKLSASPSGGKFKINSTETMILNPAKLGSGSHKVEYEVTDNNSCTSHVEKIITINNLPNVSFTGLSAFMNPDDHPVVLTGSPAGGTFSGDGISGNTFDPSVLGNGQANIAYIYTDAKGCSNAKSKSIEISKNQKSDVDVNKNLISIFPSPANHIFKLSFNVPSVEPVVVDVYDQQGKLVYSIQKDSFIGNFEQKINLGENTNGDYTVKVNIGENSHANKITFIE